MRARLALLSSGIRCEIREIALSQKPESMLSVSPKGTVPVLVLKDQVLEESLDIINWALHQSDPQSWSTAGTATHQDAVALVHQCDSEFKQHLDRYKYPNRYDLPDGFAADVVILDRRLCGPLHLVAGGAAVTSAVVRHPGPCYRLPLRVFMTGICQSESLLLQAMQALRDTMHLMSAASVCLRKHPIENLVAVWLLISMDATRERTFRTTHRDISQSLGVRREAVTLTLQRYAGHGLVKLGRGSVELTDPEGLRRWTCSCYSDWGQARGVPPTA
jgi:hypothetical protein